MMKAYFTLPDWVGDLNNIPEEKDDDPPGVKALKVSSWNNGNKRSSNDEMITLLLSAEILNWRRGLPQRSSQNCSMLCGWPTCNTTAQAKANWSDHSWSKAPHTLDRCSKIRWPNHPQVKPCNIRVWYGFHIRQANQKDLKLGSTSHAEDYNWRCPHHIKTYAFRNRWTERLSWALEGW